MSTDTPNELVARLLAAIDWVETTARAACGRDGHPAPDAGERWQWEHSHSDDPLVDQPVDLTVSDEYLADGGDVALRSIEEYPTYSVGPLPHFVVSYAQEQETRSARHIAMHDPVSVLRLCRAHRDLINQYRQMIVDGDAHARSWAEEMLATVARGLGVEEQSSE